MDFACFDPYALRSTCMSSSYQVLSTKWLFDFVASTLHTLCGRYSTLLAYVRSHRIRLTSIWIDFVWLQMSMLGTMHRRNACVPLHFKPHVCVRVCALLSATAILNCVIRLSTALDCRLLMSRMLRIHSNRCYWGERKWKKKWNDLTTRLVHLYALIAELKIHMLMWSFFHIES